MWEAEPFNTPEQDQSAIPLKIDRFAHPFTFFWWLAAL